MYMTKLISQNNMKYENFFVSLKREEFQLSVNHGIRQILVTLEQKQDFINRCVFTEKFIELLNEWLFGLSLCPVYSSAVCLSLIPRFLLSCTLLN